MIKKIGKKNMIIIGVVLVIVIITILIGLSIWNHSKQTSKLTCTKQTDETNMQTTVDIQVKFRDDKIQTMNINTKIKLSGSYLKNMENLYSSLITGLEEYKEKEGATVKSNKTKDTINVKLTVDIHKNPSLVSEASQSLTSNMTKELTKQTFEGEGYTCK